MQEAGGRVQAKVVDGYNDEEQHYQHKPTYASANTAAAAHTHTHTHTHTHDSYMVLFIFVL